VAFNPKDLGAYRDFLDTQSKISKVMSKSSKDFASGMLDAARAKRDLNKLQKQANKLEKEEVELKEQLKHLDGDAKKNAEARLAAIKEERKETDKLLQQQQALSKALSSQVGSVKNLTLAVGRDLLKATTKVVKKAAELGKEFTEIDDNMRRTAINIGVVGKQMNTLRRNAYKASLVTQKFGVDAKELVQMYGSYVDEVGRLIPMTQKSAIAMAYLSKNTALGSEGAASFAASMEVMGMSIEGSAKYADEINKYSKAIGVNSGKTIKLLASNLKKAQTINFKGGVDGMAKMAAKAVSLRADMSSTLDLAQQLWEPEKAIETAAQLQMMGGAFAKMADPLKLMFDARNNPEKLMTDLAEAAGSVVKRSKEGLYEIPTMELQKLKQIAEATGKNFDDIVQTAKTAAKQNDIGKMLNPRVKGDARDMIKNLAQFNTKSGKFEVTVDGKPMEVAKITKDIAQDLVREGKETEARAEAAQSFMTRVKNMIESLKTLAMRFFMGMEGPMRQLLEAMTGDIGLQSLGDKMESLGASLGEWIATVGVPFIKGAIPLIQQAVGKATEMVGKMTAWISGTLIPITKMVVEKLKVFWKENGTMIEDTLKAVGTLSGLVWKFLRGIHSVFGGGGVLAAILLVKFPSILKGAMAGLKGIMGMFSKSKRVPQLVEVINMGAMGNQPGGQPGGGNMLGGRSGPRSGPRGARARHPKGAVNSSGQKIGGRFMSGPASKGGKSLLGKLGKLGPKMGKLMGPLALVGIGADIGRMFMDDPDTTMGKTLGVLGTTASDAAMGAMMGSMLGPMGTAVGGILGGIVGFGRSMYKEINTKGKSDFDMSGAQSAVGGHKLAAAGTSYMADGAVMPNGNVIKTAKGKMFNLSPRDVISVGQPGGSSSYGGGSNHTVTVGGTINLSSGGSSISLDGLLSDPVFKAEITKVVIDGMKNNNR
jgi:hypothetical protein